MTPDLSKDTCFTQDAALLKDKAGTALFPLILTAQNPAKTTEE